MSGTNRLIRVEPTMDVNPFDEEKTLARRSAAAAGASGSQFSIDVSYAPAHIQQRLASRTGSSLKALDPRNLANNEAVVTAAAATRGSFGAAMTANKQLASDAWSTVATAASDRWNALAGFASHAFDLTVRAPGAAVGHAVKDAVVGIPSGGKEGFYNAAAYHGAKDQAIDGLRQNLWEALGHGNLERHPGTFKAVLEEGNKPANPKPNLFARFGSAIGDWASARKENKAKYQNVIDANKATLALLEAEQRVVADQISLETFKTIRAESLRILRQAGVADIDVQRLETRDDPESAETTIRSLPRFKALADAAVLASSPSVDLNSIAEAKLALRQSAQLEEVIAEMIEEREAQARSQISKLNREFKDGKAKASDKLSDDNADRKANPKLDLFANIKKEAAYSRDVLIAKAKASVSAALNGSAALFHLPGRAVGGAFAGFGKGLWSGAARGWNKVANPSGPTPV